MNVYGMSAPDVFRIDDLLDFSNADIFSSADDSSYHHTYQLPASSSSAANNSYGYFNHSSASFTDDICLPSEDVAELEWLSTTLAEDPIGDMSAMNLSARESASFQSRSRSKRSRSAAVAGSWTATMQPGVEISAHDGKKGESSEVVARRCTHCASEKTPQWRTGPLGPKTLCNACGVRYKSGRLVPEYRPAASPTFVLTQHSNSHRKVLELRRQKELLYQEQQLQQEQEEMYGRHFQVC